jgi:transposase
MLKHGSEYVDPGQDYYEKRYRQRILNNLKRNAKKLGYTLVPTKENMNNMTHETA